MDLHLPEPNPYMAQDFTLKCNSNPDVEASQYGPRLLEESAGNRLWFRQDTEYKLPKSFVSFNLVR